MSQVVDEHRQSLREGFAWLGGATVLAKIIDIATMLILLTLLTKQQVGVGSLVISFGMILEALNGLGTSEALIQAPSVSRLQRDSVFWYVQGAALLTGGLAVLASPLVGRAYGVAGITAYFLMIAAKQPLVGAALIPLAMLNRDLRYQRIATVNLCATLGTALTRLMLGLSGAGAWALVAGFTASGAFTLVGALIAQPYRPRLRFRRSAMAGLARFGTRAASSNIVEQMFKNVDYLLVGWFYGAANLAIYRVAFDIAMEPAMAIAGVVTRTALPVLVRLGGDPPQRARVLGWSLRRIALLVAPLTLALLACAWPVTTSLHDGQGHSYAAAALPLCILAVAALLRVIAQMASTAMLALGRPGLAARQSVAIFLLLTAGISIVGVCLGAPAGLVGAASIWLLVYPGVLVWDLAYLRKQALLGRS